MDRSIFDGSNVNIKYGKKFQYLEKFIHSKMYSVVVIKKVKRKREKKKIFRSLESLVELFYDM